jgi:RNA polymerase sigma-70 factor (ECF subfamily)
MADAPADADTPPRHASMPDEPVKPHSFAELYRATIQPLRRYLGRMLADRTEAQDVAHDAYLRLYPHVIERPPENPEALLFTTARRLALNRLKRRHIAPFATSPADTADHASAAPGVTDEVMARQDLEQLEHAIADLPAGCRSVLLLRKVELLSHREIAERLGIAISTVEKQHARALRLLRIALQTEAPSTDAASRTANSDPSRP